MGLVEQNKEFYVPDSKDDWKSRIAMERRDALERLNNLTSISTAKINILDFAIQLVYEYDSKDSTPEAAKHKFVRGLIGRDLLIREMFEEDGTPSHFSEWHYPDLEVDPSQYSNTEFGNNWETAREKILELLYPNKNDSDGYSGHVGSSSSYTPDLAKGYADKYGKESIIALPFTISIGNNGISIDYVEDFEPPYGGTYYNERTVYVKIDNFRAPRPSVAQ